MSLREIPRRLDNGDTPESPSRDAEPRSRIGGGLTPATIRIPSSPPVSPHALSFENARLRNRIAELERMIGLDLTTQIGIAFALTPSQAKIAALLLKRGTCAYEAIAVVLHSIEEYTSTARVIVWQARCRLLARGIEVETLKGFGLRLAPAMKAKMRDVLAEAKESA